MVHTYYPVALDLKGKRCLVAGGGSIATDKVEGLLVAGAEVVVVSPSVTQGIADLAAGGRITLHRREYRPEDLAGVFLAYGATDRIEVNAAITADARARGVLVNAVDDPPNCDFFAMAIVRRGDLQIAISTNGLSPAFARWLREKLESTLPEEYADLLSVLADVRQDVRSRGPIPGYEHWQAAIDDELLLRVRHGDLEGARSRILGAVTVLDGSEQTGRWVPSGCR